MDFQFHMPVRVVGGAGCIEKRAELLPALGSSCLIITGENSARKSGALDDLTEVLEEKKIRYGIFDQIGPNPLLSVCFQAGAAAREMKADFIFGIGGGSPLDAAKAAAVFAANPGLEPEEIYSLQFPNGALPIALIGTTAGTGSEVTATAVLTVDREHRKKSVTHPELYARIAFADPVYTETCPRDLTVSAALDAVCHAVESCFSPRAGVSGRAFSAEALRLILPRLSGLIKDPGALPDKEGREALYYGSLWAGLAINQAGTGFPHAAGYILSTEFGIPHGKACAVFLPDYIRLNAGASPALAAGLRDSGTDPESLIETVSLLTGSVPVQMTAGQCREYAGQLEGRKNLKNSVRPVDTAELEKIYSGLFGGK